MKTYIQKKLMYPQSYEDRVPLSSLLRRVIQDIKVTTTEVHLIGASQKILARINIEGLFDEYGNEFQDDITRRST